MGEADAASSPWSKSQLKIIEGRLNDLLKSWRSRYRYVITFKSSERKVIRFDTMWCRRPTPHSVIPDTRVQVEFAFRFSSKDVELLSPQITYRLEQEAMVHKDLKTIDHHIRRVLKSKLVWHKDNLVPLENAGILNSRLAYTGESKVLVGPAPNNLTSGLEDSTREKVTLKLESELVDLFKTIDVDGNGSLDPEEFKKLLLDSDLGFKDDDVVVLMRSYDANDDGLIVYNEFIPMAVDIILAKRAVQHAKEAEEKILDEAAEVAEARLEGYQLSLKSAISQWREHDEQATGWLPEHKLAELIAQLPIQLSDDERWMLQMDMSYNDGMVEYKPFVANHEKKILEVMQELWVENKSTVLELHLRNHMSKRDTTSDGKLPANVMKEVIRAVPDVELTDVQLQAILNTEEDMEAVDYFDFARKMALIVYHMKDKTKVAAGRLAVQRSAITPIRLLAAHTRKRVEKQLRIKFREFDSDDDGYLTNDEFHRCISDTSLCLSKTDIEQLYTDATNGQGGDVQMSIQQFMTFGYDKLLQLARDAALKHQFST